MSHAIPSSIPTQDGMIPGQLLLQETFPARSHNVAPPWRHSAPAFAGTIPHSVTGQSMSSFPVNTPKRDSIIQVLRELRDRVANYGPEFQALLEALQTEDEETSRLATTVERLKDEINGFMWTLETRKMPGLEAIRPFWKAAIDTTQRLRFAWDRLDSFYLNLWKVVFDPDALEVGQMQVDDIWSRMNFSLHAKMGDEECRRLCGQVKALTLKAGRIDHAEGVTW